MHAITLVFFIFSSFFNKRCEKIERFFSLFVQLLDTRF